MTRNVANVTLAEAVVAAEEMELTGLSGGDVWHIANHIRDYGRGNEVSPAVTRAIEQANAAPVGDIEAPPEALNGTARRIAENLRNLVTANPPILPRQS